MTLTYQEGFTEGVAVERLRAAGERGRNVAERVKADRSAKAADEDWCRGTGFHETVFRFRDWADFPVEPVEPRPCTVKVEGLNPKDERALKRVPLWSLPPIGAIHGAQACGFGVQEYGAYNWREKPIKLMEYLGALERHIACLKDGQWRADDSKVTHLGHMNATTAIILDAEQCGTLIDDRPKRPGRAHEELRAYRDRRK